MDDIIPCYVAFSNDRDIDANVTMIYRDNGEPTTECKPYVND